MKWMPSKVIPSPEARFLAILREMYASSGMNKLSRYTSGRQERYSLVRKPAISIQKNNALLLISFFIFSVECLQCSTGAWWFACVHDHFSSQINMESKLACVKEITEVFQCPKDKFVVYGESLK